MRQWKGSQRLPFAKSADLADSAEFFSIIGVNPRRKARGRFPEQIVFVIQRADKSQAKLTLSVTEDREALEAFVKEDPRNPVGPCRMTAVDANTPSGIFYLIETSADGDDEGEKEPPKKSRKR